MRQASFLARVLLNYGTDKRCTYSNSQMTRLAAGKYIVLELRQCDDCGLRFRWPKQTSEFSEKFYESSYKEGTYTTDLPHNAPLDKNLRHAMLKMSAFPVGKRTYVCFD